MAQGTVKTKAAKPASKPVGKSAGITKKGARTIAPKNAVLRKQQKLTKKFSSGLTAQTERMLGQRAGHLEMLGGGRKKKSGDGPGGKGISGSMESVKGKHRAKGK